MSAEEATQEMAAMEVQVRHAERSASVGQSAWTSFLF